MKHRKTVEQEVINFIKKHDLISGAEKILIGLSGGADSVFALHFFNKYSKKYKIEIAAIHVNHNLRGKESKRDEKFCRDLCEKLNVEFLISKVDVTTSAKKNKQSLEEAARILRYNEFEKSAESTNSDLIITSHNNDDNTETVLLNIVNGSGLSGISGIPHKRENIIRPFLCLSKSDIIDYLNQSEINFVIDSSNENLDFRRNYLRKKIIPELKKNINPAIDKVVLNSSENFRNQNGIIKYFINEIIEKCTKVEEDVLSVSISDINSYPKVILGEFLKTILDSHFSLEFNHNKFEKIRDLLKSQVGCKANLGKKIFATRERGKIVFQKESSYVFRNKKINIGDSILLDGNNLIIEEVESLPEKFSNSKMIEFISRDKVGSNLLIRKWELGDKIQLLGMNGTKKISDVLTDLKIPSLERKKQLVLVNNNEIVWLVGQRINEKYKVTSKTKSVLKLWLS